MAKQALYTQRDNWSSESHFLAAAQALVPVPQIVVINTTSPSTVDIYVIDDIFLLHYHDQNGITAAVEDAYPDAVYTTDVNFDQAN